MLSPIELGSTETRVMRVIDRDSGYQRALWRVFGEPPRFDRVAMALATYVRTIVSGDAPVDRYVAGDTRALGESARRGLQLFTGRAGCASCHSGPTFTDELFHNTGVAWRDPASGLGLLAPRDPGRADVTGRDDDRGAFKTPTLREAARTAPYMHDGSVRSLDAVIDFYDRGGQPNPALDPKLRPLQLTAQDKRDLVSFLQALSGRVSDGN
jgi:cytochrome c peroxidase